MKNADKTLESILTNLKADADASPRGAFRTNAKIRMLNMIQAPHPLRIHWYQKPIVFRSLASSALATVILGTGTVYAAQSSLPISPLYPVKIISERVALTLSPSKTLKNVVANTIVSRRIEEIQTIQSAGSEQALEQSIKHLDEDLSSLNKRTDISHEEVERTVESHGEFLNSVRKRKKSDDSRESKYSDESPSDRKSSSQTTPETETPTPTPSIQVEIQTRIPELPRDEKSLFDDR